jgi:hypothetical protein
VEVLKKVSPAEGRVAELDGELATLASQHEAASKKIRAADGALLRIKSRQEKLAVAVIAEDDSAVRENDELTDALVREERQAAVARSALSQLEEKMAQAKEARKKAISEVHRERFNELARERGHVEAEIEEAMSALLDGLTELGDIHARQIREAQGVDERFSQSVAEQSLNSRLQSYLGARLHPWGVPTTAASTLFASTSLAEADSLAVAEKGES